MMRNSASGSNPIAPVAAAHPTTGGKRTCGAADDDVLSRRSLQPWPCTRRYKKRIVPANNAAAVKFVAKRENPPPRATPQNEDQRQAPRTGRYFPLELARIAVRLHDRIDIGVVPTC